MLTEDEMRLMAHAIGLRHDEHDQDLWFCPDDLMFVEAVRLWERGYLDRRWNGDDLVYRATDSVMTGVELTRLIADAGARQN